MDKEDIYDSNSTEIHAELFEQDIDDISYDPIESNDDIGESDFGY